MSKHAILQYYNKVEQYRQFGGTRNELSLRRAFANLLEEYCAARHLILVDEVHLSGTHKRPDGTVKDGNRFDWGYWESKDADDNLNAAIADKLALGYPTFNILFENTCEIVLIQHGEERLRGEMRDADRLHRILTAFVEYERPEIAKFREAVEQFTQDIPDILQALRQMIAEHAASNSTFKQAYAAFWKLCKESINPEITAFDVQEMLIQHILTAEIFDTVFGDSHFHRENNIARELEQVVNTFFTGATRRNTLARIENYYNAIKAEAARIQHHHEKQQFLKVVYENFYKAYNPKGADKLGIVYTPNEIVKFMIDSTETLLEQHFGASLADKDVEILDPATGTGTFITEILEHIPAQYLEYKYAHEIHANEVAILPYYIANLNIEYTYQQKMGTYAPFTNIVLVDTLDNLGFDFEGKQGLFKGFGGSIENLERIQRQNTRKISVIIGNPPYNAKQMNYNDFNPNRRYKEVDERIRKTYSKLGTAQNKNQIYDMYFRFFRWASDRIASNGVICLITNHSYLYAQAFDGFRKAVMQEFDYAYFIDLGGDVRNRNTDAPTGNVFGILTGVAIAFLVKKTARKPERCIISFTKISDALTRREKLEFLRTTPFHTLSFEKLATDDGVKRHDWFQQRDASFDEFLPILDKQVKSCASDHAVFKLFSAGNKSQRDEWVYDISAQAVMKKMRYFIKEYQRTLRNPELNGTVTIKWDRELLKYLSRKIRKHFEAEKIVLAYYRPYTKRFLYFDRHFNGQTYRWNKIPLEHNTMIGFISGVTKPFSVLAANTIMDLNSLSPAAGGCQCLPRYRYDKDGNRLDNITDWGLRQFTTHYENDAITKDDVFYYTYAVLHNPAYRKTYELNLKREFPRLPFYQDVFKLVNWGKALMELHINYETVAPYPLTIQEAALRKETPKAKLRAIPEDETIIIDENTTLTGLPETAWTYKLGNRSALHWILDQYKEKTPDDATIAAQFNTYKFAEYKTNVIDLLQRVCAVSVKTVEIMNAMEREEPHASS